MAVLVGCKHDSVAPPGNNPDLSSKDPCHPDTVYFENDVLPLIVSSCATSGCHDAITAEEDVVLDNYKNIMKEVKKGNAKKSELYKVLSESGDERMPPPPYASFTNQQKQLIGDWIDQGAIENKCQGECDTTVFTFSGGIQPIINKYCVGCHNSNSKQGNVALHTYDLVKLSADDGSLLGSIKGDGFELMPPGDPSSNRVPDCQITVIEKWIKNNAPND